MSTSSRPSAGLLDVHLPQFTFGHHYRVVVGNGDIEQVYAIARDLDLSKSGVIPVLFKLRGLPVARLNTRAFTAAMGWSDIAEDAPTEFLIGYRRSGGRIRPFHDRDAAAAPDGATTQKVAFSFRFRRLDTARVQIDTETRVLCVGRSAELKFWPYWLAIKPFSGLVRTEILKLIKQQAEAEAKTVVFGAANAGSERPRPTTVMRLPAPVLVPLRAYFQVTGRMFPGAALGAFKALMRRIPRLRLRPAETAFLRTAERLDFPCGDAVLAGYTFGAGPTVLLVHGLLGNSANFEVLIGALVRRGYRVVAFDSLNHGLSPDGTTISAAPIRHIRHVISQLGDLHAVISHSAGTYLVMLALLDFPIGSVLKKCVYLAPYPVEVSLSAFVDYFRAPPSIYPQLCRWFEQIAAMPFEQQSFAACLPLHRTPQRPARLFVHDRDDKHIPLYLTQQLLADDPGSELMVTEGLGHFRILKDDRVIDRIAGFLAETESVRGAEPAAAPPRGEVQAPELPARASSERALR